MKGRDRAHVVTVLMGLGHLRAAYPLRGLTRDGLVVYGSKAATPGPEYRIWKRLRRLYYASSRAGAVPVVGKAAVGLMLAIERIAPYYPKKDLSRPTSTVMYLDRLIEKKGFCRGLEDITAESGDPVIHTFYATAVALDKLEAGMPGGGAGNYLLICDADFNRVWVPRDPRRSRIRYFAPCTQVRNRLLAYGVGEENIFMTGFPLPKENLGSETGLEILKKDLYARLVRLDPAARFIANHRSSVVGWLGRENFPAGREDDFNIMFAIGGAGAQTDTAAKILKSLKDRIVSGGVRLTVSCGIQKKVFERVLRSVNRLGLAGELGRSIRLIYDRDVFVYLDRFNAALRRTDVLWTKPSELVFYCGLGLPILMSEPIGTHEELNKRWLRDTHAGVTPPGPVEACREWLFDLRDNGRLAEAAWDGFLKSRKLGTYKIEKLIRTGMFREGVSPLER